MDRINHTAIMFAFRQGLEPETISDKFKINVDRVYLALIDELRAMQAIERTGADPRTKVRRMPSGRLARVWR